MKTSNPTQSAVERLPASAGSPARVRLSRKKGWKLPRNTVVVSRPSIFGNPYKVTKEPVPMGCRTVAHAVNKFHCELLFALAAVKPYGGLGRPRFNPPFIRMAENLEKLRGKNLACWCALDQPCHADVLLRLANAADQATANQ